MSSKRLYRIGGSLGTGEGNCDRALLAHTCEHRSIIVSKYDVAVDWTIQLQSPSGHGGGKRGAKALRRAGPRLYKRQHADVSTSLRGRSRDRRGMCARKDEADFVRGQLHVPPGMEAAKTVFCHKRTPLNTNRQRSSAQVQRPRSLAQSQQLMSASTLAEAGEGRGGRRKVAARCSGCGSRSSEPARLCERQPRSSALDGHALLLDVGLVPGHCVC